MSQDNEETGNRDELGKPLPAAPTFADVFRKYGPLNTDWQFKAHTSQFGHH